MGQTDSGDIYFIEWVGWSLCQGWRTYSLSRAAWIVHYRWRAAKSMILSENSTFTKVWGTLTSLDLLGTCLSWSFVLTRCCALTWATKSLRNVGKGVLDNHCVQELCFALDCEKTKPRRHDVFAWTILCATCDKKIVQNNPPLWKCHMQTIVCCVHGNDPQLRALRWLSASEHVSRRC